MASAAILGVVSSTPAGAFAPGCALSGDWIAPVTPASKALSAIADVPSCLVPGDWGAEPVREASLSQETAAEAAAGEQPSPSIQQARLEEMPDSDVETSEALPSEPGMTMNGFLDKLMHAESGGRAKAKNPLSTALGPFQFIDSTFLSLVRRHFLDEVAGLSQTQILALRTDAGFARKAVAAFTRENANYLEAKGVKATYPGLRLAHLLGPAGAVTALKTSPETPLSQVFSRSVLQANPFMHRLTVSGLIRRAERELGLANNGSASSDEGTLVQKISVREEISSPAKKRTTAKRTSSRGQAAAKLAKRSASRARVATKKCHGRSTSCGRLASDERRDAGS